MACLATYNHQISVKSIPKILKNAHAMDGKFPSKVVFGSQLSIQKGNAVIFLDFTGGSNGWMDIVESGLDLIKISNFVMMNTGLYYLHEEWRDECSAGMMTSSSFSKNISASKDWKGLLIAAPSCSYIIIIKLKELPFRHNSISIVICCSLTCLAFQHSYSISSFAFIYPNVKCIGR